MPQVAKPSGKPVADDGIRPPEKQATPPAGSKESAREATKTPAAPDAAPPASPPPASPPPPARGGFWPLFLGGIVAAAIGAGAAWYAIPHLPEGWRPGPAAEAPEIDLDALKQQILAEIPTPEATGTDPEAIEAALAEARPALEEAARGAAADEVARRLADGSGSGDAGDLAAAVAAHADRLEDIESRLNRLATDAAPRDAAGGTPSTAVLAPDALDGLRSQMAKLRSDLDDLAARDQGGVSDEDLAGVEKRFDDRLAAAEAAAESMTSRLETVEARLAGVAAANRAAAALRSGNAEAVAEAGDALQAAGLDEIAQLAGEAAPLAQLQEGYDRAARAALSATRAEERPGGTMSGIGAFLADQTRARSVRPRAGDDPDAIQSRASAQVEAGNIAAALNELEAMPEAGRAAMADWLAKAEGWVAAQEALDQIAQPAISGE